MLNPFPFQTIGPLVYFGYRQMHCNTSWWFAWNYRSTPRLKKPSLFNFNVSCCCSSRRSELVAEARTRSESRFPFLALLVWTLFSCYLKFVSDIKADRRVGSVARRVKSVESGWQARRRDCIGSSPWQNLMTCSWVDYYVLYRCAWIRRARMLASYSTGHPAQTVIRMV